MIMGDYFSLHCVVYQKHHPISILLLIYFYDLDMNTFFVVNKCITGSILYRHHLFQLHGL